MVGENFPWPANGGGLIRLANSIEALSGLGEVDLFTLCDRRRTERAVPVSVRLARVGTTPYPEAAHPLRWRASWAAHRGMPLEVVMRRSDRSMRSAFDAWVAGPYDLVWFSTSSTYEWLGRPTLGPTVIDLVDLEDEKEQQRSGLLAPSELDARGSRDASLAGASAGPVHPTFAGTAARVINRLRWSMAAAQSRRNARDWHALQRSVSEEVERVVLSSPLDVHRSGLSNATWVPNGLRRPDRPLGRPRVGRPPSILLQGSLNYAPNMDAADWLVQLIAPRIRARVPGCEIRLVGRPTPGVERLHSPPAVTVVGRVPDMGPELERADLVVVPIRYGSGTRVKILEAFAHRIPVVSTTIGAEGLDVADGVHLLLADDPEVFAERCEQLLTDTALRGRLVDAADQLFLERYELSSVRERIRALVHEVVGGGSAP